MTSSSPTIEELAAQEETLVFASFAGSVVGVGMIASGRGGMQAALPFGTFLAIGALVAALLNR